MLIQIFEKGKLVDSNYNINKNKKDGRVVILFSCGVTSFLAAKLAIDENNRKWKLPLVAIYTRVINEPEDNLRFLSDAQDLLGIKVLILTNEKYNGDIYEVQEKKKYIAGIAGAPCTTELKWRMRKEFVSDSDIQVFGFEKGEEDRLDKFANGNGDINISVPLICQRIDKPDAIKIVTDMGLLLPLSYRQGFQNANCIGCVKGGAWYWNKVRKHYPVVFLKQSKLERKFNAAILKRTLVHNEKNHELIVDNLSYEWGVQNDGSLEDFVPPKIDNKRIRLRIFLDRLPLDYGRGESLVLPDCGVLCELEQGL